MIFLGFGYTDTIVGVFDFAWEVFPAFDRVVSGLEIVVEIVKVYFFKGGSKPWHGFFDKDLVCLESFFGHPLGLTFDL